MEPDTQIKIAELKQVRAIEHFKSVISMAELALRSAILINGAAAVSLMTFVGNAEKNSSNSVVYGLFSFAIGVLFGAIATLFGYLSQNEFMRQINENESLDDGVVIQKKVAIWLCGLSYGCFAIGVALTSFGFLVRNI